MLCKMGIAEIMAEKRKDNRRVRLVCRTSSGKREPSQWNRAVRTFKIRT